MKKIIIMMVLFTSVLFAEVHWVKDLDDAYDIAAKEHKKVFVLLSQKGCPACKYMKNVVLQNSAVQKALAKDFIAVHLDIHEDFVPLALEHFVTPTLYFLKSDETVIKHVNGYENAKDFLAELQGITSQ